MTSAYMFDGGPEWWRHAVVYQILPASFQDSDGNGMGDLPGILSRLDHLEWLGVDAVWLSPFYPSPMLDCGYDVADFTAVDPVFGTLEDFDALLEAMHARGIRLLLDFVANHSSDRHPWFEESRSSRDNPKREWYIWADAGTGGGPPNNWLSRFGGSAWDFDARTGQYYLHSFLKEQPDLNWREPQVREAMADVLRFWLRRGVDGFRVDASAALIKDALLRDDPPNPKAGADTPPPDRQRRIFTDYRPEAIGHIAEVRAVIDEFPERLLIGEVDATSERAAHFYGDHARRALHLPINFSLHGVPWDARSVVAEVDEYLHSIPSHAWPNWALGAHDKSRIASRIGPAQARVAAMLHLTLPGTAFFYEGDELGMPNVDIPPDRIRDPFEKLVPGYGLCRDPERTPMRWTPEALAGFSTGDPWLPIGPDTDALNVQTQVADKRSMAALYRRLIALRHTQPALRSNALEAVRAPTDVVAFRRSSPDGETMLVALNLGASPQRLDDGGSGRVLLSTHLDREGSTRHGTVELRPDEGLVVAT